jgi:hypothetical protein
LAFLSAILVAIGGIVYTQVTGGGSQVTLGLASLWIDSGGGPCVWQSSPVTYAQAQVGGGVCGSMAAAQSAAVSPSTVRFRCGSYPAQSLPTTTPNGQKSGVITYEAETHSSPTDWLGALTQTSCVTLAQLDIDLDKIHVIGIEATPTPWTNRGDVADMQFQDIMDATTTVKPGQLSICRGISTCTGYTDVSVDGWKGPSFFTQASGVTIDHSNFGGWDLCFLGSANAYRHIIMSGANAENPVEDVTRIWPSGTTALSNVVMKNSVFHDQMHGINDAEAITCNGVSNGPHGDMLQANGGTNITLEKNAFWSGSDKPIQWTVFNGVTTMTGINVQNNYFGSGFNTNNVFGQTLANCSGVTYQNNLIPAMPNASGGCTTGSGPVVRNNIAYNNISSCVSGASNLAVYSHNVVGSGSGVTTCGGVALKKCDPSWVSLNNTFNLHRVSAPDPTLASSDTCAQSYSDAVFPADDWQGNSRPNLSADAGPSEIGTAMTGTSLGACSPSPCTAGTLPSAIGPVNQVSLGTINNDFATESDLYYYYVPQNLRCHLAARCATEDLAHKPAAVVLASGSGTYPNSAQATAPLTQSYWNNVADANNIIILLPAWPTNCVAQVISTSGSITTAGNNQTCGAWQHPKTTCDMFNGNVRWSRLETSVIPSGNIVCDTSTINAADKASSIPALVAMVNDATTRFGLDTSRIYMTGASSGGSLTREALCDSRSSELFRAYAVVSNGWTAVPGGSAGNCPNTANRNHFYQYVSGPQDSFGPYTTVDAATGCTIGGPFTTNSNMCTHRAMGFDDNNAWLPTYFGCTGGVPAPTLFGTPSALNRRYDYHTGCVFGTSPQVEFINVTPNGGHTWTCLDGFVGVLANQCGGATPSTNGFFTAQQNWNFFAGTTN